MTTPILKLIATKKYPGVEQVLFDLLSERTPTQSISHIQMPTWEDHVAFVSRHPYRVWYIITAINGATNTPLGAVYLTKRNEIGVQIFEKFQRQGVGKWAVNKLIARWSTSLSGRPVNGSKEFYANINPQNEASIAFFGALGFDVRQLVLALPVSKLAAAPTK